MNAIFIELIHWRWITTLQFEALKLKAKGTIHLGLKLYSKHKPQNQIGGWRSEVDYKMHSHKSTSCIIKHYLKVPNIITQKNHM